MVIQKHVLYLGGGRGDAIRYFDKEKTQIYGFKPYYFLNGSVLIDLAHHINDEYVPLYYVKNIKRENNPPDMFFADIEPIGNLKNTYNKETSGNDWFVGSCKALKAELQERLDKTSFFKLSEKSKLKEYINTLQEMVDSQSCDKQ